MHTRWIATAFVTVVLAVGSVSGASSAPVEARRAYDFVNSVGVNTHWNWRKTVYGQNFDQLKDMLADLGIRHIRDRASGDFGAQNIETLAATLGVRLNGTVDMPGGDESFESRSLDAAVAPDVVKSAMQRLGPSVVTSLEGPNEYDNAGKQGNANWASDLRTFMSSLRQSMNASPEASGLPLVSPSIASTDPATFRQLGDLSQITNRGNLHAYSRDQPTESMADRFVSLAQIVNPGQPIFVTEYGWQTAIVQWKSWPLTPRVQAKYLPRGMMTFFANPRIEKAFIYQLADPWPNPENDKPAAHFGLIANDLTPKPAFYAVRNTMQVLCDADAGFQPGTLDYTLSGDTSKVRQVLLEKGDGTFYLVLWQDVSSYEKPKPANNMTVQEWQPATTPVTLSLARPAAAVRTYLPSALDGNPDAGRKPKDSYERTDSVSLNIPDELLVVEIVPEGVQVPNPPKRCAFDAR